MANHPQAIKRNRQSLKRRERNVAVKTRMRTHIKRFLETTKTAKDQKAMEDSLRMAISMIDRAVAKGTIHRNTASRKISRLNLLLRRVSQPKG